MSKKTVDWRKIWKQRDSALDSLEYNRVNKTKIKQTSTLIINDLFEKKSRLMAKAVLKIRGYQFRFSVSYETTFSDKTPKIRVSASCDSYHDFTPLAIAISEELSDTLGKLFNQIDELIKGFMIGLTR